jgi:hypothetical protein
MCGGLIEFVQAIFYLYHVSRGGLILYHTLRVVRLATTVPFLGLGRCGRAPFWSNASIQSRLPAMGCSSKSRILVYIGQKCVKSQSSQLVDFWITGVCLINYTLICIKLNYIGIQPIHPIYLCVITCSGGNGRCLQWLLGLPCKSW